MVKFKPGQKEAQSRSLRLFEHFPVSLILVKTCVAVFLVFDASFIVVHNYYVALYQYFSLAFDPVSSLLSRYIPAIDDVATIMLHKGYAARMDLMKFTISLHWILFATFIVIGVISVLMDFRGKWSFLSRDIWKKVQNINGASREFYLFLFFLLAAGGALPLYFGFGYYSLFPAYSNDIDIFSVSVVFMALITMNIQFVILAISYFYLIIGGD